MTTNNELPRKQIIFNRTKYHIIAITTSVYRHILMTDLLHQMKIEKDRGIIVADSPKTYTDYINSVDMSPERVYSKYSCDALYNLYESQSNFPRKSAFALYDGGLRSTQGVYVTMENYDGITRNDTNNGLAIRISSRPMNMISLLFAFTELNNLLVFDGINKLVPEYVFFGNMNRLWWWTVYMRFIQPYNRNDIKDTFYAYLVKYATDTQYVVYARETDEFFVYSPVSASRLNYMCFVEGVQGSASSNTKRENYLLNNETMREIASYL